MGSKVPDDQCILRPGDAVLRSLGLEDQGSLWMNIGVIAGYWLLLMTFAYAGLWRLVRSRRAGRKIKVTNQLK